MFVNFTYVGYFFQESDFNMKIFLFFNITNFEQPFYKNNKG